MKFKVLSIKVPVPLEDLNKIVFSQIFPAPQSLKLLTISGILSRFSILYLAMISKLSMKNYISTLDMYSIYISFRSFMNSKSRSGLKPWPTSTFRSASFEKLIEITICSFSGNQIIDIKTLPRTYKNWKCWRAVHSTEQAWNLLFN